MLFIILRKIVSLFDRSITLWFWILGKKEATEGLLLGAAKGLLKATEGLLLGAAEEIYFNKFTASLLLVTVFSFLKARFSFRI